MKTNLNGAKFLLNGIFKMFSTCVTREQRTVFELIRQKHVREMYTSLIPTVMCKTVVCRGIHVPIFLVFDPIHGGWVPVRTASVLSKLIKKYQTFSMTFSTLLHGHVFVMQAKMSYMYTRCKNVVHEN